MAYGVKHYVLLEKRNRIYFEEKAFEPLCWVVFCVSSETYLRRCGLAAIASVQLGRLNSFKIKIGRQRTSIEFSRTVVADGTFSVYLESTEVPEFFTTESCETLEIHVGRVQIRRTGRVKREKISSFVRSFVFCLCVCRRFRAEFRCRKLHENIGGSIRKCRSLPRAGLCAKTERLRVILITIFSSIYRTVL